MLADAQGGIAFTPGVSSFDKDKTIERGFIESMLAHDSFSRIRLQRRKPKDAMRIAVDDELDRPRTEIADAVEEDDGRFGWHRIT